MGYSISGQGGSAGPSSAGATGSTINLSTPINIAGKGATLNNGTPASGLTQYLPMLLIAAGGLALVFVIFKKYGK